MGYLRSPRAILPKAFGPGLPRRASRLLVESGRDGGTAPVRGDEVHVAIPVQVAEDDGGGGAADAELGRRPERPVARVQEDRDAVATDVRGDDVELAVTVDIH